MRRKQRSCIVRCHMSGWRKATEVSQENWENFMQGYALCTDLSYQLIPNHKLLKLNSKLVQTMVHIV